MESAERRRRREGKEGESQGAAERDRTPCCPRGDPLARAGPGSRCRGSRSSALCVAPSAAARPGGARRLGLRGGGGRAWRKRPLPAPLRAERGRRPPSFLLLRRLCLLLLQPPLLPRRRRRPLAPRGAIAPQRGKRPPAAPSGGEANAPGPAELGSSSPQLRLREGEARGRSQLRGKSKPPGSFHLARKPRGEVR